MPLCTITGEVAGDELELRADDCFVEYAANKWIEAGTIAYDSDHGVGVWNDGQLEIAIETGRRYTSVPDGLPEWWVDHDRAQPRSRRDPAHTPRVRPPDLRPSWLM